LMTACEPARAAAKASTAARQPRPSAAFRAAR